MKEGIAMKRIHSLPAALLVVFLFAGCGTESTTTPPAASAAPAATVQDVGPMHRNGSNKALVVYFSYPENTDAASITDATASASVQPKDGTVIGNTALIADMISRHTGSDLFSIRTEKKYPANYDETVAIGREEERNHARPPLTSVLPSLDEYDTIFLGYPNWWGDMPMALYTFLDTYDLSGKTVIPFVTSGGSGFSDTERAIKEAEPGATVLPGLALGYSQLPAADAAVVEWLRNLGYGR